MKISVGLAYDKVQNLSDMIDLLKESNVVAENLLSARDSDTIGVA